MTTTPTDRQDTLAKLKKHLATTSDLEQIGALLNWDQNTYMPAGAATARGQQMATLGRLVHERRLEPSLTDYLDELDARSFDEDSDDAALLRVTRRDVAMARKIPSDFLEEFTRLQSEGQHVWAKARADADFSQFAPTLKKLVDYARRQADYLGYDDHPYDALHDLYERGSSVAKLRPMFARLREVSVPLVRDIVEKGRDIDVAPVQQSFDESKQEQFGVEAVSAFGYDFTRGRIDRTVHPFATDISQYDVRITTRYQPNFLNPALFGTMHEAGHAMYEQGSPDRFYRTPLAGGVSLGIHESQSRLWENLVGRSRAYWQHAYPRLQEVFPQLEATSLDDFYAAINKVEPSFIRVEADEITYNLHVMVRFELELAMLEGSLDVDDLPDAWNAKYEEYLGVTPPDDAIGCLQDIHWSFGALGYFPTYTLGNVISVQLFDAAKAAHPSLEDDIAAGNFTPLFTWLRENVHQHGKKYDPDVLLKKATGRDLDPQPYLDYLDRKFRSLYGI